MLRILRVDVLVSSFLLMVAKHGGLLRTREVAAVAEAADIGWLAAYYQFRCYCPVRPVAALAAAAVQRLRPSPLFSALVSIQDTGLCL
jgi:hypothetical protein